MTFKIYEKFKLSDNFIEQYKGKQPKWGPLGYITYKRSYARDLEKGTEEFWQTCQRVVEGVYTIQLNHCKTLRLYWNARKAQYSAQEMFKRMFEFKWLPPGRGLYAMGTDVIYERGSMMLYNCGFVSTQNIDYDFADPFCWLMDCSMNGVGVGFDTRGAGKFTFKEPKADGTFIIPDSREGWVEAIRLTLTAFTGKIGLPEFDYSLIRPAGAPLVTSGGIAPGPDILKICVNELIEFCTQRKDKLITSVDIVDLMNIIGRCVVSGGKRRTAEIAFGNLDDIDYMQMKDPKKFAKELKAWRWASNNSVLGAIGMDYSTIIPSIIENGEPGIIFLDTMQNYGRIKEGEGFYDLLVLGANPCAEISLEDHELCNVCETFPSLHEDFEDYKKTLKFAYLYAKTVTLIPTHCERVNQVQLRNRRIGLSMSGITQAIEKFGTSHFFNGFCDEGYNYLEELDVLYSNWLCIPLSKKKTTVKPSGTVSLLPGVPPGIHYPHSKYYYRTMRLDINSSIIEPIINAGYRVEDSAYKDNTKIVFFPVKEETFKWGKNDVTIWQQLELGAKMQFYWSDNSVSQTVTFKKDEINQLQMALELFEDRLKTISFLPLLDHQYEQAPYIEITEEEYKKATEVLKPIKLKKVDTHEITEKFCDTEACDLISEKA